MKYQKAFATAAMLSVSVLGVAAFSGAVSAEDCEFSTPAAGSTDCSTNVDPKPLDPAGPATPAVTPTVEAQTSLPVTGGETLTLAAVGAVMIGGGALLVRQSRRPESVPA